MKVLNILSLYQTNINRIRVLLAKLGQSVSQKREYIIGRLYIKETNTWLKRKVTTTL